MLAARELGASGARLLAGRLGTAAGELDLVALEGPAGAATLVVVEVKTRRVPAGRSAEALRWRPADAVPPPRADALAFAAARLARSIGCARWRLDLTEVFVRGRSVEVVRRRALRSSGRSGRSTARAARRVP